MSFPIDRSWKSGMTGMAGNLRVASELLLRELNVSLPCVDTGVDLEVEGLVRLQVKAAHAMKRPDGYGGQVGYTFTLHKFRQNKTKGAYTVTRKFSDKCHFVVLWGIEQNRFWIVPADLLDGRMTIYVGPEGRWIATDAVKIKAMLDAGHTQRDIAHALGVSEMTMSRRIRKVLTEPCEVIANLIRIRECEGRWDYIQTYLNTVRDVDTVAPVSTGITS